MSRTALITGASSGIGLELAKLFAADGCDLVLIARSEDKLNDLSKVLEEDYNIKAHVLAKDLSQPHVATTIYEWTQKRSLHIDFLINNAGFGDFGFFVESDWAKQERMINLNILTLTHLTRLFLPGMVKQGYGRVLNVASTAAFQPGPTMSVYYATKAFVLHFTEAIDNELADSNVSATALCPGATESGFQSAAEMEESKLVKGKKLPTSEEVARYGYKAMHRGKTVAIHGWKNYFLANSVRFTPRSLVVKITRMIQDKA